MHGSKRAARIRRVNSVDKGKKKELLRRGWRHEAVRKLKGLTRAEKTVLKDLTHRADDRGHCWPRYRTLASDSGYCVKTIQRALNSLEKQQLIRRKRFVAYDGRQGGYSFAITLPIPVRGSGHYRTQTGDTESAHKDKSNTKDKSMVDCYRLLEDDVLERLSSYIDWNGKPELLSVFEVTIWAVARTDLTWDETVTKVLQATQRLQCKLNLRSAKLSSWKRLIDELTSETVRPSNAKPGSLPQTQQPTDKWVVALMQDVEFASANLVRLQRCLCDVTSREIPGAIIFETDSRFTADLIAQECRRAFQSLSNKFGRGVALHCKDQKICESRPNGKPPLWPRH